MTTLEQKDGAAMHHPQGSVISDSSVSVHGAVII